MAGWEHFAHDADIGLAGSGPTKAEAFRQAAIALTAIVTDPQLVRADTAVTIACTAPNDELLFVEWLNAIVYEMAVRGMLFGDFGIISAGGVGFDISCGVRTLRTGLTLAEVEPVKPLLATALSRTVPAGVGSHGRIHLDEAELDAMLRGGARWAVESGYGEPADLELIEERGCMSDARPDWVSARAKRRQQDEMGTLGSGNHYLEVQRVTEVYVSVRPDQGGILAKASARPSAAPTAAWTAGKGFSPAPVG